MAKYSDEFKLGIVQEYLEGSLGYELLAKKYGILSASPIKKWVTTLKKNRIFQSWFETAKVKGPDHLSETKAHLYEFYDLVKESGIEEFIKAIGTLQNWQKEIMNSFRFDLHNGYIEGINNQTKVLKRNAFGFRRFDRFRSKILLHHQYKNLDTRVA